jgi:acetolactate synthase-1/2/3 large subunit
MSRRLDRRKFLRGAAGTAAALGASARVASPQQAEPRPAQAPEPSAAARAAETAPPGEIEVLTTERSGSDFMVDVLKSLGFDYVCANPGSTFRGLHESLINYGGNAAPELITCCHEESAVGMAHGYFKASGRPLAVMLHGAVGTQHGAMAVYNAFCDRVPVFLILGNLADAAHRRPGVEWTHTVQNGAALLRDFLKWDDQPGSLEHFAESAVRAYQIAMTPPTMPVAIVADGDLQEDPIDARRRLRVPRLTLSAPPQGDPAAVEDLARLLVAAELPVLVADRAARTPAGLARLVELAGAIQAPVIDQNGRMNFPTLHPLNQTERARALIGAADVIVGLEVSDFWGTVHAFRDQLQRSSRPITRSDAKLASISSGHLQQRSNYQDFQRYPELDLAIAGDAESTLPALIEAVRRHTTPDRRRAFEERGRRLAEAHAEALARARAEAAYAWDASPISTARLCAELWAQIRHDDWALVTDVPFVSRWPLRLWRFERHYQYLGGSGGAGVGYAAPASIGAALANKAHGRLTVAIQNDGDLMYAPGVLWTAAHHRIPVLSVMHNNRAYHQEIMHVQRMALRHNRGADRAGIGSTLTDPDIDYAKIAAGMGLYAEGPISNPRDLAPALKRAADRVRTGEPALVDVVTQPR